MDNKVMLNTMCLDFPSRNPVSARPEIRVQQIFNYHRQGMSHEPHTLNTNLPYKFFCCIRLLYVISDMKKPEKN